MTTIIGVKLGNRTDLAPVFQAVLTKFGCIIKTRLGLHEVSENKCAPHGVILLEVIDDVEGAKFVEELKALDGAEVQTMKF